MECPVEFVDKHVLIRYGQSGKREEPFLGILHKERENALTVERYINYIAALGQRSHKVLSWASFVVVSYELQNLVSFQISGCIDAI